MSHNLQQVTAPNANGKDLARAWVTALRSGEYHQGEGYLCKDGHFCCLGVLAHIGGVPHEAKDNGGDSFNFGQDDTNHKNFMSSSWIARRLPELSTIFAEDSFITELMDMNDTQRKTFAQIADVIEARLL